MPDDSAGNFTLVPSYLAEPGQTITTTQHNPPLEDIAAAMSRRLSRDGRGSMTGDLNFNGFRGINVGAPVTGSNIARLTDVRNAAPVGGIIDFAGEIAPPDWLFCNGQAVSRSDYAFLFTVIGTKFGAGDGVTTFNVPDLRGRVTAGVDNMGGAGAAGRLTRFNATAPGNAGGSQEHTLSVSELAAHTHDGTTASSGAHTHSGTAEAAGAHSHTGATVSAGNHTHSGNTSVGGGHTHSASFQAASTSSPGADAGPPGISTLSTHPVAVSVSAAGDHTHSFVTTANGAHTHNITVEPAHTHSLSLSNAGDHVHTFTTASSGSGTAHNNIQPTMAMNKIIRAR